MFEELKGGDGIPYISVGTFIETGAHPCLRGKHLNLPYLRRDFP